MSLYSLNSKGKICENLQSFFHFIWYRQLFKKKLNVEKQCSILPILTIEHPIKGTKTRVNYYQLKNYKNIKEKQQ